MTQDSPSHNETADLRWNAAWAFLDRAARTPGASALVAGGTEYSYGELGESVCGIADALHSAGIAEGARVGLLHERFAGAYAALLGIQAAGAAYVPLALRAPVSCLAERMARAELDACVVTAQPGSRAHARAIELTSAHPNLHVLFVDPQLSSAPRSALHPPRAVTPNHPAYLLFTSGSTGTPKAVVTTCGNIAAFVQAFVAEFDFRPEDRFSQHADLCFDMSIFDMFPAWHVGASVHVPTETERMAPALFAERQRISVWTSVPSLIAMMNRVGQTESATLEHLRYAFLGGEAVTPEIVFEMKKLAPEVEPVIIYGPTETTVVCMIERCGDALEITPERGVLSIGRAWSGVRLALVDARGVPIPESITSGTAPVGELAIAGPQVACGYWREPELTASRFVEGDFDGQGMTRWYLSGDLVRRDNGGRYHHLGRIDNQVKLRGHRIELEDIDAKLRDCSGATECVTIAWPIKRGNAEGLVSFLSGSQLSPGEVHEALRTRLPGPMVPDRIECVPALPHNSSGKIDRSALLRRLKQELILDNPDHAA